MLSICQLDLQSNFFLLKQEGVQSVHWLGQFENITQIYIGLPHHNKLNPRYLKQRNQLKSVNKLEWVDGNANILRHPGP